MAGGKARDERLDRARGRARAGRLDEAAALCRQVLAADPASVRARRLLGGVLRAQGRPQEGIDELREALAAAPGDAEVHQDLGAAFAALGRHAEAADAYRRATELRPEAADAWAGLAAALRALGRGADAADACRRALALRPGDVPLRHALGRILQDLGHHEAARATFEQVLAAAPGHLAAAADLGNVLQELDRYGEAAAAFGRALAIDPGQADVHYGLANTLMLDGQAAAAVASFDRALALRPDRSEWRFNRGHALLALGRLDEAWADLDVHWRGQRRRSFAVPEWGGERLDGRLLVWSDQGIGDEVLGCGLLRDAAARTGGLVVECDPRLVPLLRRSFPGFAVMPRAEGPPAAGVAAHVPMTALPRFLRRGTADFPAHRGYLLPDPGRVAALRARYREGNPRLVVGLSWRSANRVVGGRKSFGLPGWAAVLRVPGVRFVSLQYGEVAADVAAARAATGVAVTVDPAVDPLADLDGFAAQVAAMDLVITVSNSTAHVAGGLAKSCWLMLPGGNGLLWHWIMCKGDGCPWYPAIRVFRQDREHGWAGVMARVGRRLLLHGAA